MSLVRVPTSRRGFPAPFPRNYVLVPERGRRGLGILEPGKVSRSMVIAVDPQNIQREVDALAKLYGGSWALERVLGSVQDPAVSKSLGVSPYGPSIHVGWVWARIVGLVPGENYIPQVPVEVTAASAVSPIRTVVPAPTVTPSTESRFPTDALIADRVVRGINLSPQDASRWASMSSGYRSELQTYAKGVLAAAAQRAAAQTVAAPVTTLPVAALPAPTVTAPGFMDKVSAWLSEQAIAGIPNSLLLAGAGTAILFFATRKK